MAKKLVGLILSTLQLLIVPAPQRIQYRISRCRSRPSNDVWILQSEVAKLRSKNKLCNKKSAVQTQFVRLYSGKLWKENERLTLQNQFASIEQINIS